MYKDGDRIFLFGKLSLFTKPFHRTKSYSGFSRGAYQVRVLAGMIEKVRVDLRLLHPLTLGYRSDWSTRATRRRYRCRCPRWALLHVCTQSWPDIYSAYELYAKSDESHTQKLSEKKLRKSPQYLHLKFKTTFCRENVHVHFVGVWYAIWFLRTFHLLICITGTQYHP